MFLALIGDDLAEPMESGPRRATCPCCSDEVIAKTGETVSWHWAHRSRADCDTWSEGETDWHLEWKRAARDEGARLEIPMRDESGSIVHRADIVMADGTIIEVQHSKLMPAELEAREDFYAARGGIRWIFDHPALGWLSDPRDRSVGAYGDPMPEWVVEHFGAAQVDGLWGQFGIMPKMLAAVRAPMAWDVRDTALAGSYITQWASRPFTVQAWGEWAVRLEEAPDVLTSDRALRATEGMPYVAPAPVPIEPTCLACGGVEHPEGVMCRDLRDALWSILKDKGAPGTAKTWARGALGLEDQRWATHGADR